MVFIRWLGDTYTTLSVKGRQESYLYSYFTFLRFYIISHSFSDQPTFKCEWLSTNTTTTPKTLDFDLLWHLELESADSQHQNEQNDSCLIVRSIAKKTTTKVCVMANISQQIQSWLLVGLDTLLLLAQVQQFSPSHDFLLPSFPFVFLKIMFAQIISAIWWAIRDTLSPPQMRQLQGEVAAVYLS